jgi:hypothetical protein
MGVSGTPYRLGFLLTGDRGEGGYGLTLPEGWDVVEVAGRAKWPR